MNDVNILETIDPMLVSETIDPSTPGPIVSGIEVSQGTTIGSYTIEERLSEGTQATTYLCHQRGKHFVIKLYRSGINPSDVSSTLAGEVEAHHIAPLVDRGRFRDCYWELYPYYAGGTLENLVQSGQCSARLVERVLLPCLVEALAYLGSQGLVHADLKPANVFFSSDLNEAVLGDLGVATPFTPAGQQVAFRGSLAYAPRGVQNDAPVALTPGYDWGSLGLLLCYAYAGRQPLEDARPRAREDSFAHFDVPLEVPRKARDLIRSLVLTPGGPKDGEKLCRAFLGGRRSESSRQYRSSRRARHKNDIAPIEFGVIYGRLRIAHDASELLELCEEHGEMARYLLDSNKLPLFLCAHEGGAQVCARYINPWVTASYPARVFMLCCALRILSGKAGLSRLSYDGHIWENPLVFLDAAIDGDAAACELLSTNLFTECLYAAGMAENALEHVRNALDVAPGPVEAARVLRALFAPSDKDSLLVGEKSIESAKALAQIVSTLTVEEISQIVEDPMTRPWLYRRGLAVVYKEVDAIHE